MGGLGQYYPESFFTGMFFEPLNELVLLFLVAAASVTASAPGNYQLKVDWAAPTFLYPSNGTDESSGPISRDPGMSGPW